MERRLLFLGAMSPSRYALLLVSCTLLGAGITAGAARAASAEELPSLQTHHGARVARDVALTSGESPAVSFAQAEAAEPVASARSAAPRPAPRADTPDVLVDDPAPFAESSPPLWDDLFPGVGGAASATAGAGRTRCYDQLQGVGGISPCPADTQRLR